VRSSFAAIIACCALAVAGPRVRAQGAVEAPFSATTLNISAFGEVKLPPDMATVTMGVETTAPTASEAMRANAERMSRVLDALKAANLSDRDIQTSQLSLSPQYAYEPNQPPRLTGYQASNQITASVTDLARLGRVADAVVSAGATNVGQISFGLANPTTAENTARVAAVKALEDKAALYASASGYRISRLVNISEGGGYRPPGPAPMMLMAAKAEPTTPVSAGEVSVRIDISGVFELAK
jgi:hypothetical protein